MGDEVPYNLIQGSGKGSPSRNNIIANNVGVGTRGRLAGGRNEGVECQ